MVEVKSYNGTVDIMRMDGTQEEIVCDIGAAAHKILILVANDHAKSAQEVYIRYGVLARQLVDYIDKTVERIEELGG